MEKNNCNVFVKGLGGHWPERRQKQQSIRNTSPQHRPNIVKRSLSILIFCVQFLMYCFLHASLTAKHCQWLWWHAQRRRILNSNSRKCFRKCTSIFIPLEISYSLMRVDLPHAIPSNRTAARMCSKCIQSNYFITRLEPPECWRQDTDKRYDFQSILSSFVLIFILIHEDIRKSIPLSFEYIKMDGPSLRKWRIGHTVQLW